MAGFVSFFSSTFGLFDTFVFPYASLGIFSSYLYSVTLFSFPCFLGWVLLGHCYQYYYCLYFRLLIHHFLIRPVLKSWYYCQLV